MDLFHPSCITMLSSLNFLSFPGLKQRWMKSLGRKETFHMKTLENSPTCLRWVCRDVLLHQGSPNLFLESRCPAEFSSNPNQTHLNQLIKVLLGILETSRQVCWGKLELNSAGVTLQGRVWWPLFYMLQTQSILYPFWSLLFTQCFRCWRKHCVCTQLLQEPIAGYMRTWL